MEITIRKSRGNSSTFTKVRTKQNRRRFTTCMGRDYETIQRIQVMYCNYLMYDQHCIIVTAETILMNILIKSRLSWTLGPAYNEFGYYEHPPTASGFLFIKIIVKKFGYCEHAPTMSIFLCISLLVLNGIQCNSFSRHRPKEPRISEI